MRLGKTRINLQSLHDCALCFEEGISGREDIVEAHKVVGVPQPGICEGVARVLFDCLLEIFDVFLQAVGRALVPVVAALDIKLIRFGILAVALGQSPFPRRSAAVVTSRRSPGRFP
jgi:hypothetical protein